ncbi:MAG TPA: Wzz/FepE/Etk N-terminal domain-containing protein [Bryobacteraceae bacterium]|nr:Wzz/FepE/Etk N-terminal domain-containing protein [Bryobacteraceae bacterium]
MSEQFDLQEYLAYLGRHVRFAAMSCAAAMVIVLVVSLLLPKRYTATASILIDAPAGNDPRASTAVSPIYLESLKTYEQFASSDTLFQQALDHFHLRDEFPTATVSGLKRRVLTVVKPRDTRLIEIAVTLPDAVKAQALGQYIAEHTVKMNRDQSRQSDQDLIDNAQRDLEEAALRVKKAEEALNQESLRSPLDTVRAEVDNMVELRARVRKDLLAANVDVADYTAQQKDAAAPEAARLRIDLESARARGATLEKQAADLDREIATKETTIAEWHARLDRLGNELGLARGTYKTVENRVTETRASAGMRTERLRVIDPGIVPQRPSFPNTPLNVVGAGFIAAIASWVFITVAFNVRKQVRPRAARAYSVER